MQLPKHIPQLDVLRGIAVLEVMLYHAADLTPSLHLAPIVRLGYTGVDLFFVLSGFLITGILVRCKDQPNYFRNFYARRALRIWPIYYVLLFFTFIVLPLTVPSLKAAIFGLSRPWQSFPFFVQNLFTNGQSVFDTVRVTWSLAIEEQFYLAWPIIVWLAPRRILKAWAFSALLVSPFVRWSVMYGLIAPINIYTNTITRLDGLALGAILAIWIPESDTRVVKYCGLAAPPAVLLIGAVSGWSNPGHWAFYTAVSLCFAGMLCAAINLPWVSNLSSLRYTGKISYALYLVHVPVIQFAAWGRRSLPIQNTMVSDFVLLAGSISLSYGLAALSWRFFESKILEWKSRFEYSYEASPSPAVRAASDADPSEVRELALK